MPLDSETIPELEHMTLKILEEANIRTIGRGLILVIVAYYVIRKRAG